MEEWYKVHIYIHTFLQNNSTDTIMDLYIKSSDNIDGLVQERRNSSVLAMELRLSCINPLMWCLL